ncbi:MAG: DUF763 domain-containing protein [Candidatus Heimdallarchaeota archaeon]|nr:MAG: DUF763 domain-containing protein [Candidatus Heimdallarchaeota archaeon]
MQRSGFAEMPLHPGKTPRWLFQRMEKLTKEICQIILDEYGSRELLYRLSNPFFFQALACVIGFDWHSSGTTTTTCGALKTALNTITDTSSQIFVAGGKGRVSKQTPKELLSLNNHLETNFSEEDILNFIRASKLSAKVDNTVIQDTFQLYHHCFFIDSVGNYTVIQQGMNTKWARRYHWTSEKNKGGMKEGSFSENPRDLIACDYVINDTLDLTAKESEQTRHCILDLINDNPIHLKKYFRGRKGATLPLDFFLELRNDIQNSPLLPMPARHHILPIDLGDSEFQVLLSAYEQQPNQFDDLIEIQGIGPKKLRALTLVSELVFGTQVSWKDPVKYSFAHGGKDRIPFPVDRNVYDSTIDTLRSAIDNAKLSNKKQLKALKKLALFSTQLKCQ